MKTRIIKTLIFSLVITNFILSQTKQYQSVKKESSITYQLTHPLHEVEATSKEAECIIEADLSKKEIKRVTVLVDVTSFTSGNSNRDSHAMEVIDAISYPDAEFLSSQIYPKGDSLIVHGKLVFHGVNHDLTFSILPIWQDKRLVVNGSFVISLTAFKVERPSLLMIPVKDELRFKLMQIFVF